MADHPSHLRDEDPLFLARIERYLDGAATDEECSQIQDELEQSAGKRESFVRMSEIIASLGEWSASDRGVITTGATTQFSARELGLEVDIAAAPPAPPAPRLRMPTPPRKIPWAALRWAAVLIVSVGVTAGIMHWAQRSAPSPAPVATFAAGTDAQWGPSGTPVPGQPLPGGKLRLEHGYAQLTMRDASVLVEAPAEFQVESATRVRLSLGKLTAEVTDKRAGFTVVTTSVEVKDLGTEFGVSVLANGDTEFHVFRGSVSITPAAKPGDQPIILRATEGGRVNAGGDLLQPESASLAFVRSMAEARGALPPRMPEGILAWWRFEDIVPPPRAKGHIQADVIADSSGHNNPLSWWPGLAQNKIAAYRYSADVPPKSMFRDRLSGGLRSCANLPLDSASDQSLLHDGAKHGKDFEFKSSFTLEAYFKTAGDRSQDGPLDILAHHTSAHQYMLGLNGDLGEAYGPGGVGFTIFDTTQKAYSVSLSDRNYADGKWHYVAAIYDKESLQLVLLTMDEDGLSRRRSFKLPKEFVMNNGSFLNLLVGCRVHDAPGDLSGSMAGNVEARFLGLLDEIRISSGVVPEDRLMAPVHQR